MISFNRRDLMKLSVAGLAASALPGLSTADEDQRKDGFLQPADSPPFEFPYAPLGSIKPVASKQIDASPLGVGFETLDRMMFDPERAYEHVGQLGVKWARCQTGWARTEREPGQYDFAWLDDVVDSLLREGVTPWFSISYGNRLYTPDAPDWSAVGWAPVFSKQAKAAWLRYTRAISQRYADRVTHWEIWNEPNHRTFWRPNEASAKDYTELVRVTAGEIRRNIPGAVIVGGALAGMPTDFLRECLESGLGDLVDRISYHPYRPVPERNYEPTVVQWQQMLAQYNPQLKLWQGENGAPSAGGPRSAGALSQLPWSETYQAKWLLRRILVDLLVGVDMTSYFSMVDLATYNWGGGASDQTNYKGLLRAADYTPKDRQNNKCRIWFDGTQRGRETFSGNDQPHGKRLARKRLPTPSAKRDTYSFAGPKPAYFAYQCLCALFDARTRKLSSAPPNVLDTTLAERRIQYIRGAQFTRDGKAIQAVWFPSELPEPFDPETARVEIPLSSEATIEQPVLVDPLSRQVFQLDGVQRGEDRLTVTDLPLLDHPLLVTDRSVALL